MATRNSNMKLKSSVVTANSTSMASVMSSTKSNYSTGTIIIGDGDNENPVGDDEDNPLGETNNSNSKSVASFDTGSGLSALGESATSVCMFGDESSLDDDDLEKGEGRLVHAVPVDELSADLDRVLALACEQSRSFKIQGSMYMSDGSIHGDQLSVFTVHTDGTVTEEKLFKKEYMNLCIGVITCSLVVGAAIIALTWHYTRTR